MLHRSTVRVTMGGQFTSRWLASVVGLANDESSQSCERFDVNSVLVTENVCVRDTWNSSQSSVSKRSQINHKKNKKIYQELF